MTDRGERPAGRHGGSHGPAEGDVVLGRDGKPLLDRYGRPVRRRPRPAPDRARESGRHAAGGGRHAKPEAPQEPSRTPRAARPPRSERPERPERSERSERSAHSARSERPTHTNRQDRNANRAPIDREKLRRERAIYDAQRANSARQSTNHDAGHGARSASGHNHPGARPVNREQLHQSRNQQRIPSEPTRMDLGGPVAGGVAGAAAGYAQGRTAGQDRHGEVQPRNNFHSNQGSNLRISNDHHSNSLHRIMWGNLMPNSPLGSTIHTPVAGMGNRASSTSKPTPMYAIRTPALTVAVVSESSARPGCAQNFVDQNSVALGVWAGH